MDIKGEAMKILCYLIKILLETGLLVAIFIVASFICKVFHIDGFIALMIVVLVLHIFGFSEGDWQQWKTKN